MTETTHQCPPDGQDRTPCCGKSPFDLPRTDRMTLDPSLVTCHSDLMVPWTCYTSAIGVRVHGPGCTCPEER